MSHLHHNNADFLKQQQQHGAATMSTTTRNEPLPMSDPSSSSSNGNSNPNTIASLQVRNRFHLQVQHLLLSPPPPHSSSWRLYPWRSVNSKPKQRDVNTTTTDAEETMTMQRWWKHVQNFIQEQVTVVLHQMPLPESLEGQEIAAATAAAKQTVSNDVTRLLQVVPFPSTIDPPFIHAVTTTSSTTSSTSTTGTTVTIPMTVLLPIHLYLNQNSHNNNSSKLEFKNETYFQKRHQLLQYIVTYLQQQQPQPYYSVHLHTVDIRKSCIVLKVMNDWNHPQEKNGKNANSKSSTTASSSSSSPAWQTALAKMQKQHGTLQIALHFQMQEIEWIQSHSLIRLLPNRNNNHHHQQPQSAMTTTTNYSVQYNYSITEDMIHALDQQQQHTNHQGSPAMLCSNMTVRHGIALIVLWCTQRGLYQSISIDSTTTGSNSSNNSISLDRCAATAKSCYFTDTIIVQMVQFLIYSKRVLVSSSSNKDPMTILIAFLTLLSETKWGSLEAGTNQTPLHDNNNAPTTNSHSARQKNSSQQQRRPNDRTVLIQPHYIGQSTAEIVQSSPLAQRYASMIQDELKFQQKQKKQHSDAGSVSQLSTPPPLTLVEFLASTPSISTPTLYHPSLQHNYLFRLSCHFMQSAQLYAKKSLACIYPTNSNISISHTDPYRHLFQRSTATNALSSNSTFTMSDTIFYTLYDAYLRIPLNDIIDPTNSTVVVETPSIYGSHWMDDIRDIGYDEAVLRGIVRTLRYALGDRIVNIQAIVVDSTTGTSAIKSGNKKKETNKMTIGNQGLRSTKYVIVGVAINPDTCYRVVDRCMTTEVDESNLHNSNISTGTQQPQQPGTIVGNQQQDSSAVREFLALWGNKAELRRFKDGAIVYAVVWDDRSNINVNSDNLSSLYLRYHNDDTWQGGIVESVIRHILKTHFLKPGCTTIPRFAFRDIVSMIDGVAPLNSSIVASANAPSSASPLLTNPMFAHRSAMKAFETLSEWMRSNSKPTIPVPGSATAMKSVLGIPLTIDRVEALSPALRYVALYPPIPHPLLVCGDGSSSSSSILGQKKCSGTVQSDPISVQICFSPSSKWPNDIKAIGAAKTAMLVEIVNGIVRLKSSGLGDSVCNNFNENSILVTPSYADVPFMGYVFRITIKADHEIRILQNLQNPSKGAERILQSYMKQSIIAAKHHALIHGVYTSHPSSSATVRLVKRWLSSHLLSSNDDDGYCVPFEVIELTVAYVYTDQSNCLNPPATVTSGFSRWLYFINDYNWQERPLVVDPQNHMNDADYCTILDQFEAERGENFDRGPTWYIVAPYDGSGKFATVGDDDDNVTEKRESRWRPSFASEYPERVVASRIVALARRTYDFLQAALMRHDNTSRHRSSDTIWHSVFQESRDSFLSYSALLRIDPTFLVNTHASSSAHVQHILPHQVATKSTDGSDGVTYESSYTRSMYSLSLGPKDLQKKLYRNLMIECDDDGSNSNLVVLTEWQPLRRMLQLLRSRLGQLLLIFYNDQYPDVIGIVWRHPHTFQSRPFSALTSEYARPVTTDHWLADTMTTYNVFDVLRTISLYTNSFVIDVKVLDYGMTTDKSVKLGPETAERSLAIDKHTDKRKNAKRLRISTTSNA